MNDDDNIATLDLSAIKTKLMHESGECWSQERADAAELQYRRFLYLVKKYPTQQTAPMVDVDVFWHNHILDTKKYASDCQQVFGYFLHHYPYLGMGGPASQAARQQGAELMRKLYEETFAEAYPGRSVSPVGDSGHAANPAFGTVAAKPAWCTVTAAAWCTVAASPAYCTVTAAERSFVPKTAYCTVSAEAADHSTNHQPAYYTLAAEPAYRSLAPRPAYCTFAGHSADCAAVNDAGGTWSPAMPTSGTRAQQTAGRSRSAAG
ncbi:MAG: glycine-rich domain-containing protein [Massilia sp.]